MSHFQPAILAPTPASARFLTFGLHPGSDPRPGVARLREIAIDADITLGLGQPLVRALGGAVARLRSFPALSGVGCAFPSTQGAVWASVTGADPGDTLHRARRLRDLLGEAFRLDEDVFAFKHDTGRDLSGYEDGTENPRGDAAIAAALVAGQGDGLDGSSFIASQRWIHELPHLARLTATDRDHLIGRRLDTNEELTDAPSFAHVKRTAQESFDPPAFMLRRSMPWGNVQEHGLYFVAFGASLDPFERVLERMAGLEDGVVDGVLRFARAISGGYYWCPPVRDQRLDLRAILT